MARASEAVRQAQTPTIGSAHPLATPDPEAEPEPGPVLQPAHLDRREPVPHVETEPEERPRTWLV